MLPNALIRAFVGLLLVSALALAGCTTKGATDSGPDPFAGDCDFTSVNEVGSNAYLVGGIHSGGTRLENAQAVARPTAGGSPITEATNQGGCYFLGLEPGKAYDVTWSKPGFKSHAVKNMVVPAGKKEILHVELSPA